MRIYTKAVAAATFLLLLAGGMVTSTGSGLAVPDWPLSFGQWMPPMEGGVLYEHGHRVVAALVGLLILVEAIVIWRIETRRWVRRVAGYALLGVVIQGLLGGATVLLRLPDVVSIAHAVTAQLVFALTVALAAAYGQAIADSAGEAPPLDTRTPSTRMLAQLTAGLILAQIGLGALVRHTGAGLAIPDFPLAYGQLIPPLASGSVALHFSHRVGAIAVALAVAACFHRVRRHHREDSALTRPVAIMMALVLIQIVLGGWTVLSLKTAAVATAHLGGGALLWATSVVVALRAHQRLSRVPEPVHAPARAMSTETA